MLFINWHENSLISDLDYANNVAIVPSLFTIDVFFKLIVLYEKYNAEAKEVAVLLEK